MECTYCRMVTLSEIDEEIKRISKHIESIQIEEARLHRDDEKDTVIRPKYANLTDLKNFQIPRGFERALPSHEVDPDKAAKLASLESGLRDTLNSINKEESMSLVRRIHLHQTRKPDEITNKMSERKMKDELRDRFLSQWTCSGL